MPGVECGQVCRDCLTTIAVEACAHINILLVARTSGAGDVQFEFGELTVDL